MAHSDLMKFWKFLTDAKFTGRPSHLATEEVRMMAEAQWWPEHEIKDVLRGFHEFLRQEAQINPRVAGGNHPDSQEYQSVCDLRHRA